jgi:hypothetical protein
VDYVPISNFICIEQAASCHARPFNDMKARGYFRHHSEDVLYSARLLADLTLFRLAPMYLKEKIYNDGRWLFADTTLDGSSPWPDPVIREWAAQLHVVADRPVYKWYHYIGTHTPAKWDADCSLLREPAAGRADYVAQATCVLTSIAALLQVMKEAGIYDQTAFIVSGDHGHNVIPMTCSRRLNSGLLGSLTAPHAALLKRLNSRERCSSALRPPARRGADSAGCGIEANAVGLRSRAGTAPGAEVPAISIPDLWSGKPIPYVEYTVRGPVSDASQWQVSDIQDYRETPEAYDPLNKSTGNGFVMGAHLREPPDDDSSSWVTGRQLAFVIGIDDPARPHTLELRFHFPAWLSGQSFTVEFNGGPPWHSSQAPAGGDEFWRSFSIPLDASRQRAGRNFVSLMLRNSTIRRTRTAGMACAGRIDQADTGRSGRAQVEETVSRLQGLLPPHPVMTAKSRLQPLTAVIGVLVPLVAEQGFHLVVRARDEFDHQLIRQTGQPVDELVQGNVGGDHDVVDQRQAEDEVGTGAAAEVAALAVPPTPVRRGVGHVLHQGQDVALSFLADRPVEPLDREVIEIHGQDLADVARGDPRELSGIAADVPDQAGAAGGDALVDERLLSRWSPAVMCSPRRRPIPSRRCPSPARHQLPQFAHIGQDQLLLKPAIVVGAHLAGACETTVQLARQPHMAARPGENGRAARTAGRTSARRRHRSGAQQGLERMPL